MALKKPVKIYDEEPVIPELTAPLSTTNPFTGTPTCSQVPKPVALILVSKYMIKKHGERVAFRKAIEREIRRSKKVSIIKTITT